MRADWTERRPRAHRWSAALTTVLAASAALVVGAVHPPTARADVGGALDAAFAGDGVATATLRPGADGASASLVQPDGKILLAGFAVGTGGSVMVSRFNADGTLDTSFGGGDGWAVGPTATMRGTGVAVARQSDGKVVVSATLVHPTLSSIRWAEVFRFTTAGALDGTFSTDGISSALVPPGETATEAHGIGVQSDGKIVLGLGLATGSSYVGRLTSSGGLDATYSGDGYAGPFVEHSRDLLVQPDNKAVFAGIHGSTAGTVRRLTTTGASDASFGIGGLAEVGTGGGIAFHAIAIRPSTGQLVATGLGADESGAACVTTVFTSNGTVDESFGLGLDPLNGHPGGCDDVVMKSDGRVVVAGTDKDHGTSGDDNFAVMQYTTSGHLDTSFSSDGMVAVDMGGLFFDWEDALGGIALQADQKIVLVGTRGVVEQAGTEVARLATSGILDTGFSGDGLAAPGFVADSSTAESLAIDASGRAMVAGRGDFGAGHGGDVVRFTTAGVPDTTYAPSGQYWLPAYDDTEVHGLAIAGSFTAVVAGETANGSATDAFVYTPGAQRPSLVSWGTGDDVANAIAVQADGKRVIAGTTFTTPSVGTFGVARLTSTDLLDSSFSRDGKLTLDFGFDDRAFAVAVQPADQRIVVAGRAGDDFALARYLPSGVLDPAFSGDGKLVTDVAGGIDEIRGMVIDSSNRIVVAGTASVGGRNDIAVARFTPAGARDTSFGGGDGIATIAIGGSTAARSLALDADGRIVVAGFAVTGFDSDMAIVRLNQAGTLDTGFDGDGIVSVDIAGSVGDVANTVAVQADGLIVAGGSTYDSVDGRVKMALVRIKAATSRLKVSDVSVVEGDAGQVTAAFTVTRTGAPQTSDITFDYSTGGGTATAGSDYAAVSGSATLAPGTTSITVNVPVNGDTAAESDEVFELTLTNVVNAAPDTNAPTDFVGVATITDDDAGGPTIAGFTPAQAVAGASITIEGSGFTGTTAVAFAKAGGGTVGATFAVVDDSQLSATVPNTAITGPVTVTTPSGTAVSPDDFLVKPRVQTFTPTSGPVGTNVTINGKSFSGATALAFGGVPATSWTVVSNTTITALVPVGAATGKLAVTTPGGTSTSQGTFTVT